METALYYTLSTIAQTLAGALAILVAVVLFKLASLSKAINTGMAVLRLIPMDLATIWPILRDRGVSALAENVEKGCRFTIESDPKRRPALEAARVAHHDWGRINRRLYTVLGVGVADNENLGWVEVRVVLRGDGRGDSEVTKAVPDVVLDDHGGSRF
jgi:hypothetical protein